MNKILIGSFLIFSCLASDEQYLENMQKLIQLEPSLYSIEIDDISAELDRFIEKRSFFCEREISLEEKKKCTGEVAELKQEYFKNIFAARKRYLEYLHKKRLTELEEERESLLKTLN